MKDVIIIYRLCLIKILKDNNGYNGNNNNNNILTIIKLIVYA